MRMFASAIAVFKPCPRTKVISINSNSFLGDVCDLSIGILNEDEWLRIEWLPGIQFILQLTLAHGLINTMKLSFEKI